jgi:hypothetical protein
MPRSIVRVSILIDLIDTRYGSILIDTGGIENHPGTAIDFRNTSLQKRRVQDLESMIVLCKDCQAPLLNGTFSPRPKI